MYTNMAVLEMCTYVFLRSLESLEYPAVGRVSLINGFTFLNLY